MATRKEIEDQIAQLQAEAEAMGDEETEYDVEIWNEKGEGARLPQGQTTRWLKSKFPDLFDPDPPADPDTDSDGRTDPKTGKSPKRAPGNSQRASGTATKYFGKRPAGK